MDRGNNIKASSVVCRVPSRAKTRKQRTSESLKEFFPMDKEREGSFRSLWTVFIIGRDKFNWSPSSSNCSFRKSFRKCKFRKTCFIFSVSHIER